MKNYTGIVPRTPPDGLLEWAKEDLDTHGLIYQAVWVAEEPLAPVLEERRPRKQKKVKVWCSACGGTEILDWCPAAGKAGYGFLHPGEVWADRWGSQREYVPTVSGDATLCPMCGSPVQVKKAAELWRWYFVPAETMKMSAAVLEDGALVLTGWNIQLRVDRDGREEVEARPFDAYIFTAAEAAKLTGWRTSYSGNGGYFREYKRQWNQPRRWQEGWGQESEIFGLTKELVESSQLSDCKLYEYMHSGFFRNQKYPVVYLRLYQQHPNVENLVMSGLPSVLDELLTEQMTNYKWEKNVTGLVDLDEIDWEQSRPSKMLGLTREELRMARSMGWSLVLWRLFREAKEYGEVLTEEDIRNAHYLGDENMGELVGRGPVGKSITYLLRQIEVEGGNPDVDAYVDPGDYIDVTMLLDYWKMCQECGYSLEDTHIRWPRNLCVAHDLMSAKAKMARKRALNGLFRSRFAELSKYTFRCGGLMIRPARSQNDLNDEAEQLHHCVWSYAEKHADGDTAIFFIRHVNEPKKSYFTLEFDEETQRVRQNRGTGNCDRTEEVWEFEALWLSWVHAGCRRDKDGAPILPAGAAAPADQIA